MNIQKIDYEHFMNITIANKSISTLSLLLYRTCKQAFFLVLYKLYFYALLMAVWR